MNKQTVHDVIGQPNALAKPELRGRRKAAGSRRATIAQVFTPGSGLVVRTEGGACGATSSVIAVEDKELRDRVQRALRPGLDVHEAAAAQI